MEKIKNETKKEVDKIWEQKLKLSFFNHINKYSNLALKEIQTELIKIDNSLNKQIQELGIKFDEKWNSKFKKEISKVEQLKNESQIKIEQKLPKIKKENNFNFINNSFNNENVDEGENYENLRKKVIKFEELKYPPLINLILLPQTNPLINIILFCLSNNKYIVQYYLNPRKEARILTKFKEHPKNDYLGPLFLKLLDYLWKSNKKEYSPFEIHNILKKLMGNNYFSNDAGLLLNFILRQLHEELINNKQINNNEDNIYDHFDKNSAFSKFSNIFRQNITRISDLFFSTIKTKKVCNNCASQIYYFEGSPIISIFLQENIINKFNNLSFNEHLKNLLINKNEQCTNEYCNVCRNEQKMFILKDIYSTSCGFIIYINRKNDKNYSVSFKYPETFDGKKIINSNVNLPNYQLTCIIKINRNKNFDFISIFKNFIDNRWYSYNNKKIELINDNYKNHIFDEKNAFLLFYCKI